jgi:hypothetical protein
MTAANPLLAPALWSALRDAEGPATIVELQRTTPGRHHHISARLKLWARAGLVEALPAEPVRYAIAAGKDALIPPTQGELSLDVWAALRRLGRPAALAELTAATGAADRALYCRIFRWIQLGHVVRVMPVAHRFALKPDARGIAEPPSIARSRPRRMPTARARIWTAMRVLKTFDVPMLMMTAEATRRQCEDYISALGRAGYVRVQRHHVARAKPGAHGFARDFTAYQLVRSTGPNCPTITCPADGGQKRLVDRNSGQAVPLVSRRSPREVNHDR